MAPFSEPVRGASPLNEGAEVIIKERGRYGEVRTERPRLVGDEAIEQAVAAGAAQIGRAAAALRTARGMRRIPRLRRRIVAQALAVDMADHRGALRAGAPVAAGAIVARRERAAFRGRSGQHVVTVRREADAGDDLAALAQRGVEAELVVVAVQIVDARRDDLRP